MGTCSSAMAANLQLAQILTELNSIELNNQWTDWKSKFQKVYSNQTEETLRFGHFSKNLDFITSHNKRYAAGKESYFVGLNKLADLTREEINSKLTGPYDESAPGTGGGSCHYKYNGDTSWASNTDCPGCYGNEF